jgi:hypothetical protein
MQVFRGLCGSCRWRRLVTSSREQTYVLCQLSAEHPEFPKYPQLPVLACRGYADVDPDRSHSTTR